MLKRMTMRVLCIENRSDYMVNAIKPAVQEEETLPFATMSGALFA